jgi:hypothetical protein
MNGLFLKLISALQLYYLLYQKFAMALCINYAFSKPVDRKSTSVRYLLLLILLPIPTFFFYKFASLCITIPKLLRQLF